ncbi:ionotropic receptor 93a-like [Haliotis rubra]|uniref:ionotropic receptor 93a-like n=1 Tax=Haliotis rubra TaxID=36100 RepID=UPI001EE56D1F|nr:ionotropic receptor 93a-like [Haliotis rubra]
MFTQAHQIDRQFGAGSLLRHFSKWLIVLTRGEVDSLILDDVLFDNVAVTTLQAMGMPVEMWETCEKKIVNGTFTYTGFCDYILSYLSRSMNFSYTYIEPEDKSWGVQHEDGSPTLPATDSQRTLLCFWWIFCILITSVYCGNFAAYLSVAKEDIPFTGLDDLLESGYDVGVSSGVVAEAIFKDSDLPLYRRIGQKIREHQRENMTPTEDFKYHYDRLIQGDYALIATTIRIRGYTANRCDIAATDNPFFQRYLSFVIPKYSPLAGLLDQRFKIS